MQPSLSSPHNCTIRCLLESTGDDASGPERMLCTWWEDPTPHHGFITKDMLKTTPYSSPESLPDARSLHPMSTKHHAWMSRGQWWQIMEKTELFLSSPLVCFPLCPELRELHHYPHSLQKGRHRDPLLSGAYYIQLSARSYNFTLLISF